MINKSLPTKNEAICLFEKTWAGTKDEGIFDRTLWKQHSFYVAEGAERIAVELPDVDPSKAYVLGLLHDIGKSIDYRGKKHALEGYRFLMRQGYFEAAYAALTHDFPAKEFDIHRQEALLDNDELEFVVAILSSYEYTIFDRLIQVCDVISTPGGYVLMEKRMMMAIFRYGGLSESLKQIIAVSYENMQFLERIMGTSVYSVLPNVVENTFGNNFK
jgi:putative nucleotidyltransferase with HDIG domain